MTRERAPPLDYVLVCAGQLLWSRGTALVAWVGGQLRGVGGREDFHSILPDNHESRSATLTRLMSPAVGPTIQIQDDRPATGQVKQANTCVTNAFL